MYSFVVSVNSILRGREYRQAREKAKKKNREASLESGFLPIRLTLRAGLAQE
jgi:hypothetical protein